MPGQRFDARSQPKIIKPNSSREEEEIAGCSRPCAGNGAVSSGLPRSPRVLLPPMPCGVCEQGIKQVPMETRRGEASLSSAAPQLGGPTALGSKKPHGERDIEVCGATR